MFEGLWHVRVGKDHQDPKNGRKFEYCSNHIIKGSGSMFPRQLDVYFYIVNKVVKARFKNDEFQICPKVFDIGPKGLLWSQHKSKPEKSPKSMNQVWYYCDIFFAVTNFWENAPYITPKIWLTSTDLKNVSGIDLELLKKLQGWGI